MKKYFVAEKGNCYLLRKDDIYYRNDTLPKDTNYVIGKYGKLKEEYMIEWQPEEYYKLLYGGGLNKYLHEVDEKCMEMEEAIIAHLKEEFAINDECAVKHQIKWNARMQYIMEWIEEDVIEKLIL